MDEARTVAWIFYAIALATQTAPANFAAISQVADGINHAVPTHKELQVSLKWLVSNGLAKKESGGYSLTSNGLLVMNSVRAQNTTTSKVWAALTKAFSSYAQNKL